MREAREAALLRKQFLEHFDRKLIPAAASNGPHTRLRLIDAALPAASEAKAVALPFPPLPEIAKPMYPLGKRWPEVKMHCIGFPYVACLLEGEADLRVGITEGMAKKRPPGEVLAGGYAVPLVAGDCLLIPPGVPYATGDCPHWERPDLDTARSRILWMHFLPVGVLIHTCSTEGHEHVNSYSLLVDNTNLFRMMESLLTEIRERRNAFENVAQAQWFALLRRIRGDLVSSIPALVDGLHSRFPEKGRSGGGFDPAVQRSCDFIRLHLHEPLTPALIAEQIAITPTQLNRLFRKYFDQSLMAYVTSRRIDTAKLLLTSSDLPVREIASLVGFLQASHFSQAFRTAEGISPLKFRRLNHGAPDSTVQRMLSHTPQFEKWEKDEPPLG